MTTRPGGDDAGVVDEWIDSGEEPVALGIVRTAARALGRDPVEMPPLFPHVDPDALESLFGADDRTGLTVAFWYEDLRVRIDSDGHGAVHIEVQPRDGPVTGDPTTNGSATNGSVARGRARERPDDVPSDED